MSRSRPLPTSISIVAVASVGFGLLSGCDKPEAKASAQPQAEAIAVSTAKAELRDVVRTVEVTGTLWGDQDVTISAKVPGRIAQIFKDVGDRVAADEPLVQIDKVDYELEQRSKQMALNELLARLALAEMPATDFDPVNVPTVVRAKLQADNAEARYNRGKQLHDQAQPLISDQDFADLRTAWDVAKSGYDVELLNARALVSEAYSRQADLQIASQKLKDTTLRAPVVAPPAIPQMTNGTPTTNPALTSFGVASRLVSVGEYVKDGTALYRLIADDPIKLRASVPERFSSQIQVGQTVTLRIESYPETFTGRLARINPQIDPANRTFTVEALFPNPDRKLLAGMFARAEISTYTQPDVLFVPRGAVASFAGATKVFAIEGEQAKEIPIDVAPVNRGDFVEVTKGLDKPLELITTNPGRLATGTKVTIKPTTMPSTRP